MKQSDSQEMMQEAIIKLAAEKYVESEGRKILEEARALNAEEGGGPSEEERAAFEKLLDRELKKQRRKSARKKQPFCKVAVVAAVILVVVNITIASVPAVRVAVLRLLTQRHEEYSRIFSDPDGKSETETTSEKYGIAFGKEYEVTYLPEGFEVKEYQRSAYGIVVNYCDEKDNLIIFCQDANRAASYVDTESAEVDYVDINGNQALIDTRESHITIVLKLEDYYIDLSGRGVSKEELIRVVKSIREVK